MHFVAIFSLLLFGILQITATVSAQSAIQLASETQALSPLYLEQKINSWLVSTATPQPAGLEAYLEAVYLQWGYPAAEVKVQPSATGWRVVIQENTDKKVTISQINISGGSPQQRYLVRRNLQLEADKTYQRAQLLQDLNWLEQNHFLPIQLVFSSDSPDQVALDLHLPLGADWFPTGNLALNSAVSLAVTAGVIVDNPLNTGLVGRALVKRNNIPFPGYERTHDIQDWEYITSLATSALPIEGMSLGINHYNKVDFIYPEFDGHENQLVWIRSLGVDLYSGFQIWENIRERQYLRGVFDLTLVEDQFFARDPEQDAPSSLTQSGKSADLLLMPSLTLSYSDIDNYRLPQNGHFLQGRIAGSVLDAPFVQTTLTGFTFWTPFADDSQQWTLLLRSAAGTTFGLNPPFYRGFLNTGHWLVRGASQFSITEKHSLRFAEELHYIYKPTAVQTERFFDNMLNQSTQGLFDDWAFDINVFLDQGAYWRDSIFWQDAQLSVGMGINAITPGGSILGVDIATSVYPAFNGFTALLRISAPLSFTLYSDWFNTNGFFLR